MDNGLEVFGALIFAALVWLVLATNEWNVKQQNDKIIQQNARIIQQNDSIKQEIILLNQYLYD